MATGNANYSTIITSTLRNQSPKIFDAVVTNNALLFHLKKAGNIRVVSGGRVFTHPILYKKNSSFAARGANDTITLPITDPVTEAEYSVKTVSGSIVLTLIDLAKNAGNKEKLKDYTEIKKMEAEVSMGEVMGDQAFGDGSGANDWDGLQKLISEDPSNQTDVGGIDPSASGNEYWRNYSHGTQVTAFNTSQAGFNAIDTSINESTFGRMGPKLMITTKAIWTLIQLGMTVNMRYATVDQAEGKQGFKALQYAGIPIVFDDNCPAEALYGVNTEAIRLQALSHGNMKQTPFQIKDDQLVESALLYFFGNLTAGDRRTSFVIDSITG